MISALDALQRLREGNQRFVATAPGQIGVVDQMRRQQLVEGQDPFAILLSCADSRAPAELIFDQGLGDLFVVRVAGNIAAPSQVGSIEYAAHSFGTRLVVVLGHTRCGAVLATLLQRLEPQTDTPSPNIQTIADHIRPTVDALLETELRQDPEALVRHAVRANVSYTTDLLRTQSPLLSAMIQTDGLLIVGAEYLLETGLVEFFDGVPGA